MNTQPCWTHCSRALLLLLPHVCQHLLGCGGGESEYLPFGRCVAHHLSILLLTIRSPQQFFALSISTDLNAQARVVFRSGGSQGLSVAIKTRSSAQGNCSAKSLAGNVIDSSLSSLSGKGGGWWGEGGLVEGRGGWWGRGGEGEGGWRGVGGRGHFICPAINCTTTWCFALKGLRTMSVLW